LYGRGNSNMDIIMPMATTDRHNELINSFIGDIIPLRKKKEVYALQSDCALVHWGQKTKNDVLTLVNIENLEDLEDFLKITINELDYVQPDFFFFKENVFIKNERGTRIAGHPDLIVEIWSKNNTAWEHELKLKLYSSSPVTEHWYIEQDSNEVICYSGGGRLENQSLTDVLVTRGGLEFDLRYLAV
jgi:Uma2 family endonuclease